ncbi:hypothetical protein C0431_12670 [bacterium]|nr:hypothetical protein [bacterium]
MITALMSGSIYNISTQRESEPIYAGGSRHPVMFQRSQVYEMSFTTSYNGANNLANLLGGIPDDRLDDVMLGLYQVAHDYLTSNSGTDPRREPDNSTQLDQNAEPIIKTNQNKARKDDPKIIVIDLD